MMLSFVWQSIRRAPRRAVLAALGVAFPVAILAATLFYVDIAVLTMTQTALIPVQVEMRALAMSMNVDMAAIDRTLLANPAVSKVDRFAATDVVVGTPGTPGRVTARLFAIDPSYAKDHPWVRMVTGSVGGGAVLDESLRAAPGFANATTVSLDLLFNGPPLNLSIPVTGTADLRGAAATWFAIPTGPVKGDVAAVPRAIVIDYSTFERSVLPALKKVFGTKNPILDPGLTDLAPVSIEAHISVSHSAYPNDPGRAARWSATLRRVLERSVTPGSIVVADNASEVLGMARTDATSAKILFVLLGIPAVLVAIALGLGAESALAEAYRREEALLRLRGATNRQITRLAAMEAIPSTLLGIAIGLLVGLAAAGAATGTAVWRALTPGQIVSSSLIAIAVGVLTMAVRLIRLARMSRRQHVVQQRRLLEHRWAPAWLRARLDVISIVVGLAILVLFVRSGGLRQTPIEGQTVALSFYLLLAPIALWLGCTLLIFRGMLALFLSRSEPDRSQPLRSWNHAARVWLARRPARTAVAMVLAALAVAFGTQVVAFVATYQSAKQADAQAAFGSDMRLTPAIADSLTTLPALGPNVSAVSSIHLIPVRAGTDRKTILAIDVGSFSKATTRAPTILAGQGVAALASDPSGILVANEIAQDYSVRPGDSITLTTFPDDLDKSRNYNFHVLGIYRSFPPTLPTTEMVASSTSTAFPPGYLPPPDFYLAKVAPGSSPTAVAAAIRGGAIGKDFSVATIGGIFESNQRTLASLNLSGLSRLEAVAAGLVAAIGIAVLGAFLVLERRREFAILRTMGANTKQILTGPAMEGIIAVIGSLVIGIPVGLGLSVLAVRVLVLFFTLPPPVLRVPFGALLGLIVFVSAASAVALGGALLAVNRVRAASVLREQ